MTPYAKTGGLADVLGSLPPALAARGHRVMIVTPKYADYEGVEYSGVTVPIRETQVRRHAVMLSCKAPLSLSSSPAP